MNDRVVHFCECCHFKQFAEPSGKTQFNGGTVTFKPPKKGVPHEDTLSSDGQLGAQRGGLGRGPHVSFGGPEPLNGTLALKGSTGTYYLNETTPCLVKIIDTPGVMVDAGGEYEQHHQFTGKVYDICQNNTVVDTRKFGFSMAGSAPAAGGSADSSGSGTAEVVAYNGADTDTATHSVNNDGTTTRLP